MLEEVQEKVDLIENRKGELEALVSRDYDLSQLEMAYEKADLAVSDAMQVIEEYLENEIGSTGEVLSGYPFFSNWQVLHDELSPRLADRYAEILRVRREIKIRRERILDHLEGADPVLKYYKDQIDRIHEAKSAEALINSDPSSEDFLKEISESSQSVAKLSEGIVSGNTDARERVEKMDRELAASQKGRSSLSDALSVINLVLGVYGMSTGSSATSNGTANGNTSNTVNIIHNEYIYNLPRQDPNSVRNPPKR